MSKSQLRNVVVKQGLSWGGYAVRRLRPEEAEVSFVLGPPQACSHDLFQASEGMCNLYVSVFYRQHGVS